MKRCIVIFTVATIFAISLTAYCYDDGDWQVWNTGKVESSITNNIKAKLEFEFRVGDNISEFYYQHDQVSLDFKVNNWLSIEPAYRVIFELYSKTTGEDGWFTEHRPLVNINIKGKAGEWTVKNRSRLEYRTYHNVDKDDVFRFRNKLILKSPWKFTGWKLNPYIADEIFVQEYKDGIYRNRLYIGCEVKFTNNVKGSLFYLWQTEDKDTYWKDTNVVGTQLRFLF